MILRSLTYQWAVLSNCQTIIPFYFNVSSVSFKEKVETNIIHWKQYWICLYTGWQNRIIKKKKKKVCPLNSKKPNRSHSVRKNQFKFLTSGKFYTINKFGSFFMLTLFVFLKGYEHGVGIFVTDVNPGSQAHRQGLKVSRPAVTDVNPGSQAHRQGLKVSRPVVTDVNPGSQAHRQGLKVSRPVVTDVNPGSQAHRQGLKVSRPVVTDVNPGSQAHRQGLKVSRPVVTDVNPGSLAHRQGLKVSRPVLLMSTLALWLIDKA